MTIQNSFTTLLSLYRSAMTPSIRKRTRNRKPRAIGYPVALESMYYKGIQRILEGYIDVALSKATPIIEKYATRNDSLDSDLADLYTQLEKELEMLYGTTYFTAGNLGQVITNIAEKLFGIDSTLFQKQVTIVAGTPINIDTEWWAEVKSAWANENIRVIHSMGTDFATKMNTLILDGIRNGDSIETMATGLRALSSKLSGYRARFLARDQIGKLNATIAKEQMTSIGMETYYWITSQDERVRGNPKGAYAKAIPSHYIMDGLLMAWNNPSVYYDNAKKNWVQKTGRMEFQQVGMAFMCRCTAAPSWNTYLKDIDEPFGEVE